LNTSWAAGHTGNALSFNGTNSLVTIPDAPALDLSSSMTLEAWVYPSALGTSAWRTIIFKEQPAGMAYALYGHDGSAPVGQLNNGSEQNTEATAPLPLNTWTHVATTYDGQTLRLYVNGALTKSLAVTGSIMSSNGALQIGGNAFWGEYFAGRIDDVRVYAGARSAPQVSSDMNTPVSSGGTPPPP